MKQEKKKQERFTRRVSLSPPCHTAVQQLFVPGPHSWGSGDLTNQKIQKETLEGISEHPVFATGWQPGTCVTDHCHPALGVPRTLHTGCCASGEVFQQNQGFSSQAVGKHTPEQIMGIIRSWHCQSCILSSQHVAAVEHREHRVSLMLSTPCFPDIFHTAFL